MLKDLKRSPDLNLEKISYENLSRTVQVIIKDDNSTAVPMDLDALNVEEENDKKSAEAGSKEEHEQEEFDAECATVYGHDGALYFISPKGKSKCKGNFGGKGQWGKGGGFNGDCSFCGKYGHRLRDCNAYTNHLQKGGERKGMGKSQKGWSSDKGGGGGWSADNKGGGGGK